MKPKYWHFIKNAAPKLLATDRAAAGVMLVITAAGRSEKCLVVSIPRVKENEGTSTKFKQEVKVTVK